MTDFFRFPHTPHLVWLGKGSPRNDKVLSSYEAAALLAHDIIVEEKLDGANIGISLSLDGLLRIQNRGQYLGAPYVGQFSRLTAWLNLHQDSLLTVLKPNLILFGEWCAARHSLDYNYLPDWFFLFDVYDKDERKFWSTLRRNSLADIAGLATVPKLASGKKQLSSLKHLLQVGGSRYRSGAPEGIVIRQENDHWCEARAKLVHEDFTQSITEHWRHRRLVWNSLL
ncbi:RNA ligase family protein [Aeromonas caviae]|uniref:RNA ligase family protein n=1 Tax=Aeromonas caviae TaxID=648 RepID=UPI0028686B55|nr:RNA ligase family protein [Aeromonas caviae]WMX35115.1 RNA ligase family protein [Aeromonas caviae]